MKYLKDRIRGLVIGTYSIKTNTMADQKQFGVWMDTHQATIVGKESAESGNLVVIAHTEGQDVTHNSSEKNENNEKRAINTKFFKEIAKHLQKATHLHITGTGQAQEQFMHYLADTAQFKNVKTEESTSNKMSDERLLVFFADKLN